MIVGWARGLGSLRFLIRSVVSAVMMVQDEPPAGGAPGLHGRLKDRPGKLGDQAARDEEGVTMQGLTREGCVLCVALNQRLIL